MIHDLKPYPAYKDSGVPWLGKVPEHWEVTRLSTIGVFSASGIDKKTVEGEPLVRMVNYLDIYKNPIHELRDESSYMQVSCPDWKRLHHSVLAGDMFFTPSSETEDDIGWSAVAIEDLKNTVYSYHVIRFRPSIEIDLRFRKYMCNNTAVLNQFTQACKGTTRKVLTRSDFRNTIVTLPPLLEQSTIVCYLDYIDRRVRRYIRAKKKLIKLLKEQRQAIIHQAVTHGLDPNVKLKPSGVEWLGGMPEHWEVRRNGQLFAQRNQTGFAELPILEVSLKTGIRVRDFENTTRKQVMSDREKYKRAVKGDIAYNMMRMWQGAVGVAPVDGLVSPAYVVARPLYGVDSRYFSNLFRTSAYMNEVDRHSRGIVKDRNRLYWEDFKQIHSPYPPLGEQTQIANAIEEKTHAVNHAIEQVMSEISLLREYRTRLIADVVTGKLDVREAAANLPDETGEMENFDVSLAEDEELENNEIEDDQAGELEEEVLA